MLVDGDEVVTDSTRILHHLEERFPEPPLFPADPAARAEVEVFLDWFNRAWKREPNLIADALERGEGDGADVARWSDRMQRRLDLFEGLLTGRDHLFGAFGAADCAAWPFLRYAVAIEPDDDELFHRVLHERMALTDRHAGAARLDRARRARARQTLASAPGRRVRSRDGGALGRATRAGARHRMADRRRRGDGADLGRAAAPRARRTTASVIGARGGDLGARRDAARRPLRPRVARRDDRRDGRSRRC